MTLSKLQVLTNEPVNSRYWHMIVDASALREEARPGQFFNIRCSETYIPLLRRPFSLFRIDKRSRTLEFLYLVKGAGTERLARTKPGEMLDVFGPLGKGFDLRSGGGAILLLARGVGVATLSALAQKAAERGIACITILSAKTRGDVLAEEMLRSYGAEVHIVTDDDGSSDVANVRAQMEDLIEKHRIEAAYTCGSRRLSRLLQEVAAEKRLFAEIALEENMSCAMGVCFACVCEIRDSGGAFRTVRICKEGPVFPLEQVVLA
ncbi:dihydroorotate dehydrogenase electron transfer subunit [Cohnella massiliensis]|uniref:dihydroorotate dehydrogenase electron transfer subunit n=1 Tax=Cohnella massiliensis TaxID=1816691 RepID=UPI001FE5353C|nr:dihydroorotate dehydrogenase electron transfer subunit [Cohnella massiliensis]